jgi:hypothetical protein
MTNIIPKPYFFFKVAKSPAHTGLDCVKNLCDEHLMLGPLKKRQILGFERCIVRTLVEQFVFMKQTAASTFYREIDRKGDER